MRVCTDSNGNKYVVEYYYHRVKKYDASGKYLKTIGSYGTGNYGFRYPTKCAIDSNDNLFVYIWYDSRIASFDSNGTFRCKTRQSAGMDQSDNLKINSKDILFMSQGGGTKPFRIYSFDNNCNVVKDSGYPTLRYNNIVKKMKSIYYLFIHMFS